MTFGEWLRWFFNLFVKEFLSFFADPASRFILFVPLVVQIFLFGYTATFDLKHVPIAVLNESNGQYSRQLIAQIGASPTFWVRKHLRSPKEMSEELSPRNSLAIVHIQSDFDAKISQGEGALVQIITDGRNSTTAGLAGAELSSIIQAFNERALKIPVGIDIEPRAWYNPNLQTQWNIITALVGTLSFIQVLMLSALSVAREREQGTFDQLLVSPYRPFEILLAKALPPIAIGILQTFIVVLFAVFWFDIPMRGSLIPLYFGIFIFTLSTVGTGLAISSVSQTMQQAMIYSFVLIVPMVILSGLVTPVYNMPEILQILTYADPLRFALDYVHGIYLENLTVSEMWGNLLPMLVIAAITLPFAAFFFRRSL